MILFIKYFYIKKLFLYSFFNLWTLQILVAQQAVKWHISFTYEETQNSTRKNDQGVSNHSLKMVAMAEMVIESANISNGHLQITMEQGDKVLSSLTSGYVSETTDGEHSDAVLGLQDTRKDYYKGKPEQTPAINFEYDPLPDGTKGLNGGLSFDQNGYYEVHQYTPAYPERLDAKYPVTTENFYRLNLGNPKDVITPFKNGFIIDCSVSEKTEPKNTDELQIKSEKKIEYHVLIVRETDIEAFIVPSVSADVYHKWLPEGPDPKDEKTTGNNISFTVFTKDKKNPDQKITSNIKSVIYFLTNVSHEPGYSMNYPSDKPGTKADLQLLAINEKPDPETEKLNRILTGSGSRDINVACFDYGAYGCISATVILDDGNIVIAKEEKSKKLYATIPYRTDDNSEIADFWKEQNKATGLKDDNDDDSEDMLEKNPYKGDGFSLYEEYRGFIENKVHIRTDPHKKDVMICDKVRDALISAAVDLPSGSALEKAQKEALPTRSHDGINMFAAVTGFITHDKFKAEEFGIDIGKNVYEGDGKLITLNLPPFTNNKVLNFNTSGYAHLHEQSGLLLLPSPRSLGYAAAFGKNKNDVRPLKDWYCLVITADFSARMEGYSSVTGDIINDTSIAVNPNGHAKIITDEYAVTVAHEMLHYCSVKHHGDVGENINNTDFKTSPSVPDKIYMGGTFDAVPVKLFWDDLKVTPITPQDNIFKNPSGSIPIRLRLQHGTCSGVEDCIMRYDDGNAYKGEDGNYYLLVERWQKKNSYSELTGINLCKSQTGTGVNASDHKPRSRYGDATTNGCQAQVCVNDKYHQ